MTKSPFDIGPEDIRLAELLANPRPSDFDEVSNLYGTRAIQICRVLIAIAARRGALSPATVVEDAIENGWKRIKAVFDGTQEGFRYRGDISIASWLVLLIGDPEHPEKGGVIHKHLRAQRRLGQYEEVPLEDEHFPLMSDESDDGDDPVVTDERIEALKQYLASLEGQEHFVVGAFYGVPPELGFSEKDVRARCALAKFSKGDTKSIVARWRRLKLDPSKRELEQEQIAALLDKSTRHVRRYLKKAKAKLLESFRGSGENSL
jgi:RNA polymerase sigma factor (sigma-70 family)